MKLLRWKSKKRAPCNTNKVDVTKSFSTSGRSRNISLEYSLL